MKRCSDECQPCCDFCKHYYFNGDANGVYIGKGACKLRNEPSDPHDECEDFYCFRVKEK